ncbi:Insulin-like growth factor binding protein, N-terminal [Pseudocohnilembus persalinus]|uniref:Insulin-like growth factor binding protein, N-terminal n=1 Tax=Pseudocohnilembus persalinus TaxID=266149 RepID=A0A0V0QWT3_PSEPJ|nr:Insulin-like growth factor binding protein, N-terminal [Pseudocohnilembus persalinus]|eukprot:KRX06541.1 Insulin-like growth factor binding protein, N-terminal [Pseudocohnilembus persalinus]
MMYHFNLIQAIQLDTSQWEQVNITSKFIQQNFKQYSGETRLYDSLQLSQKSYANLLRNSNLTMGKVLIQVLDENGYQQCNRTITVENIFKYTLTNTNVVGEFFFAYTSQQSNYYQVFFGFLKENCNFSRGLQKPAQPAKFTNTNFVSIQAKTGNNYLYVVYQQYEEPMFHLYLIILDIKDKSIYSISTHKQLKQTNFRYNLFSIQAFPDDYAIILAKDFNDKLWKITIKSNECNPNCVTCYGYDTCLSCFGDMGLNKQHKCQCPQNSIQTYGYKGQCQGNFNIQNKY